MNNHDLLDALAQLSWHVQLQLADAAAIHGLSVSQLRLLGILRDREPEMLELAAHLHLDKSSVTGLVGRAEARGLVERAVGENDRRTVVVRLTASGRSIAVELERAVQAAFEPQLVRLSDSQRLGLIDLAGTLVD